MPSILDTGRRDRTNDHVSLDTRSQFPNAKDRSREIIFATTLMDGRQIYIKGPQVQQFIAHGIVVMYGVCRFKDGTESRIEIRADSDGDNIEIVSLLRLQPRPVAVSKVGWESKISQSELEDAPDEVMEMIGGLADDFLRKIKPIVEFRAMARKRIEATLTSPKQVR